MKMKGWKPCDKMIINRKKFDMVMMRNRHDFILVKANCVCLSTKLFSDVNTSSDRKNEI